MEAHCKLVRQKKHNSKGQNGEKNKRLHSRNNEGYIDSRKKAKLMHTAEESHKWQKIVPVAVHTEKKIMKVVSKKDKRQ